MAVEEKKSTQISFADQINNPWPKLGLQMINIMKFLTAIF